MNSKQLSKESSSQKCLSLYQRSALQNSIYDNHAKKPTTSKSSKKEKKRMVEADRQKEAHFVNRGFSGYE